VKKKFDARQNYRQTLADIGYVNFREATQADYDRIGFMSGLEVHQQLKTTQKLFCRCPAGKYQKDDEFDAEVIRHMRPTLSELGEYDGTALMEFKTRKEIVYRIKNETTCTYEVDDTPPFPLNRQALEIAIEISLLKKLNIVGEVHITRKQYLDGSIPTGFQRTAIIGVEGEIELPYKKIRLIQLSIEEDSCREVSDIGHRRIYKTDRLGMPLIETVTYPDMVNPKEVADACQFIRFLNRSTGKVLTGIGAARQDVNVSCRGGTRVEIKGVPRIRQIPLLTHNESFRQWALLNVRSVLHKSVKKPELWKMQSRRLDPEYLELKPRFAKQVKENNWQMYAVGLPGFRGILSHFTQPGKVFADEISDRLKVIACIEKPNMDHDESLKPLLAESNWTLIKKLLNARSDDALLIFWGPEDDMKTALETIEERCRWAFDGVPNETRKSMPDGTTIFERVLPGADRMYPDTDSAPIPLKDEYIDELRKRIPAASIEAYRQMQKWGIPEDTYEYILKKDLYPTLQKLINEMKEEPVFAGTLLGHKFKHIEGQYPVSKDFHYGLITMLVKKIRSKKLDMAIIDELLPVLYQHPKMDFDSLLIIVKYKPYSEKHILEDIPFLENKYCTIRKSDRAGARTDWIMGHLRTKALGNVSLQELRKKVGENGCK
jgi:glutamyl-tRNA(Gln) amidotransferase subunit E